MAIAVMIVVLFVAVVVLAAVRTAGNMVIILRIDSGMDL